jgi:DNA-binding NtrC family response regulator
MINILVIDDEQEFLSSVRRALIAAGFKKMTLVSDPRKVAGLLNQELAFDIAVIDITMPIMDGEKVLSLIKNVSPFTECIMITARNEARIAVNCLKKGAYDYLVKPIGADEFIRVVNHALERKRLLEIVELSKEQIHSKPEDHAAFKSIITRSSKMFSLLREAELHALSEMPVLITGETGTGKELLARAIHDVSPRAKGPFTPINMASLSENLFESSFFGHTKGAFTDAQSGHMGFLEATSGGTLFLDEIGTLPLGLQGKLLRVLQEKEYIKLGTSKLRSADVRFVAATNMELHQLLDSGLFRKDMFYRLRGAQLHLPPLRERMEDIPALIAHFLGEFCEAHESPAVSEEAISMLMAYNYPGNIRELKAIVQTAVNLSQGGSITVKSLPANISRHKKSGAHEPLGKDLTKVSGFSLAEMEKEHICSVFKENNGNLTHSASLLGISLNTLRRKLDVYGIGRK